MHDCHEFIPVSTSISSVGSLLRTENRLVTVSRPLLFPVVAMSRFFPFASRVTILALFLSPFLLASASAAAPVNLNPYGLDLGGGSFQMNLGTGGTSRIGRVRPRSAA